MKKIRVVLTTFMLLMSLILTVPLTFAYNELPIENKISYEYIYQGITRVDTFEKENTLTIKDKDNVVAYNIDFPLIVVNAKTQYSTASINAIDRTGSEVSLSLSEITLKLYTENGYKLKYYVNDIEKNYNILFQEKEFVLSNMNGLVGLELSDTLKVDVIEDDSITTPDGKDIEKLPLTLNDRLGNVSFIVNEKNMEMIINYNNQEYRIKRVFSSTTDMTIFSESIEAFYQNKRGNPQIFINNDKNNRKYLKDILTAGEDQKPAFIPHTIWDLKTNNLKKVETYKAYTYVKSNDKTAIIAYFYTDEFIMDKIISANIEYTFRQKNSWIGDIFGNPYKEWEKVVWSYNNQDNLSYKNMTFDWQNLIPLWNVYVGIHRGTTTYVMPRIEEVDLDNTQEYYNVTRAEINSQFSKLSKDFESLKTNKGYKLWAFALSQGKESSLANIEIYNNINDAKDPNNLHIVEIVYETNGKLYTTIGNDMDLKIVVSDKLKPTIDNKTLIIVGAFAVILLLVMVKTNAFKSIKKFIGVLLGLAILAVIVYLLFTYLAPDYAIKLLVLRNV